MNVRWEADWKTTKSTAQVRSTLTRQSAVLLMRLRLISHCCIGVTFEGYWSGVPYFPLFWLTAEKNCSAFPSTSGLYTVTVVRNLDFQMSIAL